MSPAEPFPLYIPGDARRAFSSEAATRRFARVARLEPGSHVLVLGCGSAEVPVVTLAREWGCTVVAGDSDEAALQALRGRVEALGLVGRVEVRRVDLGALDFQPEVFDAILVPGRVLSPLEPSLRLLRGLLSHQGRIGLMYPARVGRRSVPEVQDFWQMRLGAPLLSPRDVLQVVESSGFEPESAESLSDRELDTLYSGWESHLEGVPPVQVALLREEVALHRQQGARGVASYTFVVGRRREPGERPPTSRDHG